MTRLARAMGWFLLSAAPALALEPSSGNQFAHLDSRAVYYPSRTFAKLTTPSWFGEPGVKAVVILSIDDMRDPDKYEAYFRPILDRLAELEDGLSPLSIMTNRVDPAHPLLARWLENASKAGFIARRHGPLDRRFATPCRHAVRRAPADHRQASRRQHPPGTRSGRLASRTRFFRHDCCTCGAASTIRTIGLPCTDARPSASIRSPW